MCDVRYGWCVEWIKKRSKVGNVVTIARASFDTESYEEAQEKAAEVKQKGYRGVKVSQCIF